MAKVIACPICGKEVAFDAPEMPFCSDRCRLLDLGNWASETYRIPSDGMSELDESHSEEPPGESREQ